MIDAVERPLEVREQHVDPAGAINFGGRAAAAGLQHGVRVARDLDAPEAPQSIGKRLCLRRQAPLHPVGQRGVVEGPHGFDDSEGRVLKGCIGAHRDQERLLVLGASSWLAAVALTAEVGVIDLHEATELPRFSCSVMACMILCFKRQAVR